MYCDKGLQFMLILRVKHTSIYIGALELPVVFDVLNKIARLLGKIHMRSDEEARLF